MRNISTCQRCYSPGNQISKTLMCNYALLQNLLQISGLLFPMSPLYLITFTTLSYSIVRVFEHIYLFYLYIQILKRIIIWIYGTQFYDDNYNKKKALHSRDLITDRMVGLPLNDCALCGN